MLVLHGLPLFASFLALLPLFPSSNPHPEKAKIMKNSASKIAIELAINIKVTGYDFGDFKHEYDELSEDDWISLVDEASCLLDDLRDTDPLIDDLRRVWSQASREFCAESNAESVAFGYGD
jgi:hypothetical protein